ncbi:hypothetical protein BOC44_25690 [Burkholderia pseudomallei]|nr:hypothetical protein BOC44_25690 [Burkholderia pseudomallei]
MGYAFDARWVDPCESLISILWKFAQANGLSGHVVVHHISASVGVDPYAGFWPVREAVDVARLRQTLHLSKKVIHDSVLNTFPHRPYCERFRFCRKCLARGYHSTLHQLECESMCPAHQKPLETACRRCGYEAPCLLSARFLESPFRCAYCNAPYSYKVFSTLKPEKMCKRDRVAVRRRYFERTYG